MTTSNRFTTSILILSVAGLAACDSSTQSTARTVGDNVEQAARTTGSAVGNAAERTGQAISDAAITTRIKTAMVAEKGLETMRIDVDTADGVVTLTGDVRNQANRDRAGAIARNMDGVREVRNDLKVDVKG